MFDFGILNRIFLFTLHFKMCICIGMWEWIEHAGKLRAGLSKLSVCVGL